MTRTPAEAQRLCDLPWMRRVRDRIEVGCSSLQASVADIVQEPIAQDDGVRDCAPRDPAGNMIRIQEQH